jgi:ubiquinone/menaquinone biosynthesis C-methylase UbiE
MTRKGDGKDLRWLRQVSSFFQSRIILTANNCRIFDHLDRAWKTSGAVAKAAETDTRATELLLNSLVAIGLIKKKGNEYSNAPVASRYLVKGKPDYQGDILRHYSVLWENWSGLDAVLKTGTPNRKTRDLTSFILGMHNLALQKVKKVLAALDLKGVKRLLDMGGGPGTYSMAFAKKKIEVTLFDFPDTLEIAKKLLKEAALEKNIRLLPGDFTKDELGNHYDMVFISQIFHAYTEDECLSMLRKSHTSLNPGGKVVIQEFYLDETGAFPPQGALFAINMLVNTPGGRTHTSKKMSVWLKKTGFRDIKETLIDETVLMTGTKK